ncbi:phage portal protein [Bacillus sp. ISL-4]|uniref:phage portal protein n=1 Tax=Bacillus sp. ISL-4 TaxID=2819125 RepID=UPI001BE91CD9|nr:phage portal protein [Bacillus sp. ISL-4]MBT2667337.1 phage portal protein [Bacillus sp. ISL-4]MBT2669427.1 phage portal protein [Streptomyces sp. ISL-14]
MNIQEYIKIVHNGNQEWFTEEVSHHVNQKRVLEVIRKREYLDGKHAILNRGVEDYNGKPYQPRKITLQYGKKVVELETTYLLKNPLTITGEEGIVADLKKVYKKGKYDKIDYDILNNIVKYGNAYEYVFVNNKGNIQSKLIQPENGYPIYNDELEMIAFVEYYTSLESDFYVVYYEDKVEKYSTVGHAELTMINSFKNVSGLPIHYKNDNEMSQMFGKSDLDDFINIIDSMEDILSKFSDSFYKHHNPIAVVIGQSLTNSEGLNQHIVGGGLNLDDGADFKMVSNELNHQAFEVIYKTLKQELINIASIPAVSLNATDVSNLSETSMKILYQLADMKAGINEKYLREGMEQRFEKVTGLMGRLGKSYDEDTIESLDVVFHYARPVNESDVIDNIKKMYDMGAISIESILDIAPLINDSQRELERIQRQADKSVTDKVTQGDTVEPDKGIV